MRKSLLCLLLLTGSAFCAGAQILSISHSGEEISPVYNAQINRTLLKEVEFYGPVGLPDTVRLNLMVFKNTDSANAFIRQYDPLAYGKYVSGMFIPVIGTAVLATTENMDDAVRTLFHEISHFLYHKVLDVSFVSETESAYSLNEGLAGYFEFMKVRKDGTVYQKPDKIYLASVKSLIEIDEFDLDEYLRMNQTQFKDKYRHDGVISYYVSYVITATLFDRLGTEKMRELLIMIRDGITYEDAVTKLYPGGKASLDEDIRKSF